MTSCPTPATLRAIGTDALDDATFAALEAHIEQCPDCLAALERLASQDSLFSASEHALPGAVPAVPGFILEGELGRGSAGVVYLAREPGLDRLVALKITPGGPIAGARGQHRWLAEARAASRLRHPNVVRLYRVEKTEEWLILVLEHVPGGTLKDHLGGPVEPVVAAGLLQQVSQAVDHIHALGLVHLDLKPSNILLDGDPGAPLARLTPKVSDFGIARPTDDTVATDTSLAGPRGTPAYMAPEQAAPSVQRVGPAADVYALGAILYHLLTGRPPYQGSSVIDVLDQIRRQEPVPPRQIDPRISRDLETICLTCLQKEPAARYSSADALANDLQRWLDGKPISARPASAIERAWRLCRRRPLAASLAAGLLITLTGSLVGFSTLWQHSRAVRQRADAARTSAQSIYQVASTSLDDLLPMIMMFIDNDEPPFYATEAREKALEAARMQAFELYRKSPADLRAQRRLAELDGLLAAVYHARSADAESLPLLEECNALWEKITARTPDDDTANWEYLKAMSFLHTQQQPAAHEELIDAWSEKTRRVVERLRLSPHHVAAVLTVALSHRATAHRLASRGSLDHARELLHEDLQSLDSLPRAEAELPEVALSRLITLTALGLKEGGTPPLAAVRGTDWRPKRVNDSIVASLAELMAWRIGLLRLNEQPENLDDLDSPEAWAQRVVGHLEALRAGMGFDPGVVPLVAWRMRHHNAFAASKQRREGRLDLAKRSAARVQVLARQILKEYPDEPESFLLLCEAHVQMAKNAWKILDFAAIEQHSQEALEAARRALALDPERQDIRRLVDDRRRRLDELATAEESCPTPPKTTDARP